MRSKKADDTCGVCGTDLMLYKCKYCGKVYCEEHRRPSDHQCAGLSEYKRQLETGTIDLPGRSPGKPAEDHITPKPVHPLIRNTLLAAKIFSIAIVAVACIIALLLFIGFIDKHVSTLPIPIPVQDTVGVQVVLTENRSATDPTFADLVRFLKADNTSSAKYVYPGWTCADFAKQLHDNAEARGIRAAFVAVDFYNDSIDYSIYDDGSGSFSPPASYPDMGHGLNLFNTTDRGPVYVDASSVYESSTGDRIAYVVEGREFNEIDLDYATGTDYTFYTSYKQKYVDYVHNLKDYNRMANDYNHDIMPAGMTIKETTALLNTRRDTLAAEKASIGPFYYPTGIVKKINVYW